MYNYKYYTYRKYYNFRYKVANIANAINIALSYNIANIINMALGYNITNIANIANMALGYNVANIANMALGYNCDNTKVHYLPNSAIFCHPVIGLLVTSALAAYIIYLFALPSVYTSSFFL